MSFLPTPCRELDVERAVTKFLDDAAYEVTDKEKCPSGQIDLVARKDGEELVIEAKGEDKGGYGSAEMNFQMGLGQLACRMYEPEASYFIAFPLTRDFAKVLSKYAGTFGFSKFGIGAFVLLPSGDVLRCTAAVLQALADLSKKKLKADNVLGIWEYKSYVDDDGFEFQWSE